MAKDAKYGQIDIPGVPDDEPVFILRGQDKCTSQTIRQYADCAQRVGSPSEHHSSARRQADAIEEWQSENPDQVKSPD